MPWLVGPITSFDVITPFTVPDCGQSSVAGPVGDGLNDVSHSQAELPALTPRWPNWMCDWRTSPSRPEYVSV
jgi:hypothetical protein